MLLLRKAKTCKILHTCRGKKSFKFEYKVVTVRMRNQTDPWGLWEEPRECVTDAELRAGKITIKGPFNSSE